MKTGHFKTIITLLLLVGMGVYIWNTNTQIKLQEEKQETELKLKEREISLKEAEVKNAVLKDVENKNREEQNTADRTKCFLDAEALYAQNWTSSCVNLGLGEDCSLPNNQVASLGESRNNRRDECFKLYPVN